jgi:hypothetical protein
MDRGIYLLPQGRLIHISRGTLSLRHSEKLDAGCRYLVVGSCSTGEMEMMDLRSWVAGQVIRSIELLSMGSITKSLFIVIIFA